MAPVHCTSARSAARSFMVLANRSYSTTTTATTSHSLATPLEFLVPRCAIQSRSQRSTFRPMKITGRKTLCRQFSVSAPRRATVCVQNPQKDEDGKDMMLEITPRAAQRLSEIMSKDKNPNLALRIQVESGGCHGFQYLMSLITIPARDAQDWSSIMNEDDSVFEFTPEAEDEVQLAAEHGPRVVLDEPSLDLLKGSKVDFTRELIGSQFKIVDNPFATSSCGCGTSFDIKM